MINFYYIFCVHDNEHLAVHQLLHPFSGCKAQHVRRTCCLWRVPCICQAHATHHSAVQLDCMYGSPLPAAPTTATRPATPDLYQQLTAAPTTATRPATPDLYQQLALRTHTLGCYYVT